MMMMMMIFLEQVSALVQCVFPELVVVKTSNDSWDERNTSGSSAAELACVEATACSS